MEYVMYNELCQRGYSVDVGVVEINERQEDGKCKKKRGFCTFGLNFAQIVFAIIYRRKNQYE